MHRFFYWLADKLRPWHESGLPEELQFPEMALARRNFQRGMMLREAQLSAQFQMVFGIFRFLGMEYVQRAARAWRPRELYLMEDLSLAHV